jgi:hypothetical protein
VQAVSVTLRLGVLAVKKIRATGYSKLVAPGDLDLILNYDIKYRLGRDAGEKE